jgi:hypothetical protein
MSVFWHVQTNFASVIREYYKAAPVGSFEGVA